MKNKTESYIILKPIAERFNRITSEISDDEIRNIIKSSLKEELLKIDFAYKIQEVIDDFLDENNKFITDMFKNTIKERLS